MYTLQCCVMDNLRVLSRMLACLDRFGKDLYLEVSHSQVSLRTLNQAQSAFVVFTLKAAFFADFILEEGATASVKLHLKNVVSIFRSVHAAEKLWIQLACSGDAAQHHMRVLHECTNGLRKKFDLAFEEVTSMNAVYSKDGCPHTVCVEPTTLLSCLTNFPPGLAEVTLMATPDSVVIKNDPEAVGLDDQKDGSLRTEMRLAAADLHHYTLGALKRGSVHVTFSMREFKAILQLVKDLEHRIVIHIEDVGKPLIICSEPRSELPCFFNMECVLATLVEAADLDDEFDGMFDDEANEAHADADWTANPAQDWTANAAPAAHGYAHPNNYSQSADPLHAQGPSVSDFSSCGPSMPQTASSMHHRANGVYAQQTVHQPSAHASVGCARGVAQAQTVSQADTTQGSFAACGETRAPHAPTPSAAWPDGRRPDSSNHECGRAGFGAAEGPYSASLDVAFGAIDRSGGATVQAASSSRGGRGADAAGRGARDQTAGPGRARSAGGEGECGGEGAHTRHENELLKTPRVPITPLETGSQTLLESRPVPEGSCGIEAARLASPRTARGAAEPRGGAEAWPPRGFDGSDSEEDEDAVPGTPPDEPQPPAKRPHGALS